MNGNRLEVYSTYFCVLQICSRNISVLYFFVTSLTYLVYVLLRLQPALRIGTQNVSWLGAVVLAPRRILSAKGNPLEIHNYFFQ